MSRLSILQWNIWYLEDINNTSRFLDDNKADVICLQELTINFDRQNNIHTPNFIAEKLGYHVYFQEISFTGKEMKLANAIFSKYPIIESRTAWINQEQGSGNYDDENRAYIEVILDVDGVSLTVGTAHMSYTHAFEPSERKLKETDELFRVISNKTDNFILTGDFNATPESKVLHKIEKSVINCGPEYSENTWTTKPFSYNGFEANTLEYRLDYIFGSKDINVVSSQVLNTEFSDHLPILVEITL